MADLDDFDEELEDQSQFDDDAKRATMADDDEEIQPQDATILTTTELMAEMERRGLHMKGFLADDAKALQVKFDEEHEDHVVKVRKERAEKRARAAKQAGLQKKRMALERQLREEQEEVAKDSLLETWLINVRQDSTSNSARIDVNSITCRALAKAMWNNTSLTSLDLSRNQLSDFACSTIARMLRRNESLKKLELDENFLGPRACNAFADALPANKTLTLLSLESNPLTKNGADNSGISALARSLGSNATLTSLSLWRGGILPDAGHELAQGLLANDTLVFLDVGGANNIAGADKRRIADKLEANMARAKKQQGVQREVRAKQDAEETERQRIADDKRKEEDVAAWMEEQKEQRAEERREAKEEERAKAKAAEEKRLEAERLAREAKEKEEAAKKSKGKKGKKGKKK